jgi:hypothetical protein
MVPFDAGIAGQITVTFDFSAVARIACFGIADFPFVADYGIYLLLSHLQSAVGSIVEIAIFCVTTG